MIHKGSTITLMDWGMDRTAELHIEDIEINSNRYSAYAILCGTLSEYRKDDGALISRDENYRYKVNFDESSTHSLNIFLSGEIQND